MLTKEECLKALDFIEEETTVIEDYTTMPFITCNHLQKEIAIIRQLIKEHFDNPPLKFEELKPKMWIWDNRWNEYKYIDIYDDWHDCYWLRIVDDVHGETLSLAGYEENRYFRKQVEK